LTQLYIFFQNVYSVDLNNQTPSAERRKLIIVKNEFIDVCCAVGVTACFQNCMVSGQDMEFWKVVRPFKCWKCQTQGTDHYFSRKRNRFTI